MARNKGSWLRGGGVRAGASWLLLGFVAIGLIAGFVYLSWGASQGPQDAETDGQHVRTFELPDIVSGRTVSLADYIGKKEIVIVSYMGWF